MLGVPNKRMIPVIQSLCISIIILPSAIVTDSADHTHTVYFDKYGDCQRQTLFEIADEVYRISAKGSGQAYQTIRCTMRFKTQHVEEQLCVRFNHYDVNDCTVHVNIYNKEPSKLLYGGYTQPDDSTVYVSSPFRCRNFRKQFGCQDSPSTVCSESQYLTVQLHKENLASQKYSIQLQVVPKTMHNEIITSLGMMVGVIVGVVCFIAALSIIILCCCCKKGKHHGRVFKKRQKKQKSGTVRGLLEAGPEPSAPPPDTEIQTQYSQSYPLEPPPQTQYSQSYPLEPPPPYQPIAPSLIQEKDAIQTM